MALIPLNTFKTKTATLTTAEYNNETCARDTGLIVDSIAFDLLHGFGLATGGTTQTTFSGLQYSTQGAIKIPGDVFQTLVALDRAKQVAQQLILEQPVTLSDSYPIDGPSQITTDGAAPGTENSAQSAVDKFDLISSIIENGTAGITDRIVPNGQDIVSISVEWEPSTYYYFGTILKTNDGSVFSYYRVINNGTSGLVAPSHSEGIEFNGSARLEYVLVDEGFYNAANLLLLNKELMQEEVVAYVNDTFATFVYDVESFTNSVKLIIDSLAFDILFNGLSQSKFAGLQFWAAGSTNIPDQVEETIAAILRIQEVVLKIVNNELVAKSPGNLQEQVFDLSNPGSVASTTAINALFSVIVSILSTGTPSDIVPNGPMTSLTGLLNAYNLIQRNRQFIQAEIIAWIDKQVSDGVFDAPYSFDDPEQREKCYRDTGYIVDCVSFDLVYTTTQQATRQCVQAGTYYYNKTSTLNMSLTEQSKTITALNYLKTIVDDVITATPISITYQSTIKQFLRLPPGTNSQSITAVSCLDLVTNIVEYGPSIVESVEPISLLRSTDVNDLNAFRLLLANKDFLTAEIVSYVFNLTNEPFELTDTPTSDKPEENRLTLCKRDVGYIVDSIVFDLIHGGNRQTVQAGVYYYDHSASVSVIPTEKTDIVEIFNLHLIPVLENVLKSTTYTGRYQSNVNQLNNLAPLTPGASRDNIIEFVNSLVSRLNRLITSGINSVNDLTTERAPINLDITSTTQAEVIKAFNILLANREYIVAEIISYLTQNPRILKRPNKTKIYTAPPGVTAIILMAQAANVTDDDISVTFAHYRNIPVFADPATYNGYQAGNTVTELVKNFVIPSRNAAGLIDGKMIVESFDSVIAYASVTDGIKVTLSILETANA